MRLRELSPAQRIVIAQQIIDLAERCVHVDDAPESIREIYSDFQYIVESMIPYIRGRKLPTPGELSEILPAKETREPIPFASLRLHDNSVAQDIFLGADNIMKLYSKAQPDEIEFWRYFYYSAHDTVVKLANKYSGNVEKNWRVLPVATVAAVVAVLSPNTMWNDNLVAAEMVIRLAASFIQDKSRKEFEKNIVTHKKLTEKKKNLEKEWRESKYNKRLEKIPWYFTYRQTKPTVDYEPGALEKEKEEQEKKHFDDWKKRYAEELQPYKNLDLKKLRQKYEDLHPTVNSLPHSYRSPSSSWNLHGSYKDQLKQFTQLENKLLKQKMKLPFASSPRQLVEDEIKHLRSYKLYYLWKYIHNILEKVKSYNDFKVYLKQQEYDKKKKKLQEEIEKLNVPLDDEGIEGEYNRLMYEHISKAYPKPKKQEEEQTEVTTAPAGDQSSKDSSEKGKKDYSVKPRGSFEDRPTNLTSYPKNVQKAINIIDTGDVKRWLSGPKVSMFYEAIMNPRESMRHAREMVLDGHAINIWYGTRLPLTRMPNVRPRKGSDQYRRLPLPEQRRMTRREKILASYDIALELTQLGSVDELQSICWFLWRNVEGVPENDVAIREEQNQNLLLEGPEEPQEPEQEEPPQVEVRETPEQIRQRLEPIHRQVVERRRQEAERPEQPPPDEDVPF